MTRATFLSLPRDTQTSLSNISAAVEGVHPDDVASWKFQVATLPRTPTDFTILQDVTSWAGKSKACLYYFDCVTPGVDLREVELAFAVAKAHEENDRAYPRLNSKGTCFYVGSSQSMSKRFAEHLGYGARRTYALQFIHWSQSLGLELEFVCAKYPASTAAPVLQALEDTLWESKAPMFGRKGRK